MFIRTAGSSLFYREVILCKYGLCTGHCIDFMHLDTCKVTKISAN